METEQIPEEFLVSCTTQGHKFSTEETALHTTPLGGQEQLFYHQR